MKSLGNRILLLLCELLSKYLSKKRFAILTILCFIYSSGKTQVSESCFSSVAHLGTGLGNTFRIENGQLWGLGFNEMGSLGDKTFINRDTWVMINPANNWVQLTHSQGLFEKQASFAFRADGSLWCWGNNEFGQLGLGNKTDRFFPVKMGNADNWKSIRIGYNHVLAIKSNGTLWGWGQNQNGQLGTGNSFESLIPVRIGLDSNWIAIAAGFNISFGIQANGSLWAWGDNSQYLFGDSTKISSNIPKRIGKLNDWTQLELFSTQGSILTLKSDGTLWGWGGNNNRTLGLGKTNNLVYLPTKCQSDSNWRSIASLRVQSLGLKTNGNLYAMGAIKNGNGLAQKNIDSLGWNIPNCIDSSRLWKAIGGGAHALATNALNKTYAWGGSEFIASKSKDTIRYFNSAIPKILHNSTAEITKISLGNYHSVLLKSDGRISVSGRNNYHQLGLVDTTSVTQFIELQDDNWIDCEAGANHTLALKANGTIWKWGNNLFGQLGDTFNSIVPKMLKTSLLWRDISVGDDHNLAIDENGKLWAWGKNNKGQLGVGDTLKRTQPQPISTDRNWRFIDAGSQHNFAIKNNGTLWGWGNNDSGQLGIGNNIAAYSPVKINNDSNWIQISCGLNFTIGLKANGSLWSWGSNNFGQLGYKSNGTILTPKKIGKDNDWVAVECGTTHVIALKSNGTVWTWGDNSEGQLANYSDSSEFKPKQLNDQSNIIQISAGSHQSGIIKSDRSMVCLAGANHFGQLADGSKLNHNFFGCVGDSIQIKILKSNNNNYCNGSRITVPFSVNKTLSNNNNFVLLLSDSNGNFSNPTILSNKASNTSDTFFTTIPATIYESNKYRLKIVSTSPISYSIEDTNNIYIHRYSAANKIITPRNTIYCNQDSVVLQIPNKYLNISWNSKNITNIISVRKSGTFKVQAYDSSNCLIVDSVVVFFSNPSLDLGFDTLENPNCKTPYFNLIVDSSWSKYEWSNNDSTYKTILKSEGLYTLRVTDTVGCQSKDSLYFKNRTDSFFSNITIKNLSCFEDKTGSINLETKGGHPPYNYIWNDSARKNNVAKNLHAGTYNCIVLDSKGCADTLENLMVIQPKKLKLLLKESGLTNCKDTSSGYILCTTTGGHSPYSYQWNSAGTDTTESIANLRPGTYLGVVRDSNLCLDSLQISIEQANSPKINLEHIDSIACFGKKDASIRIRITGGQKPIKNYFNNTLTQDTSFLNLGPSSYYIRVIDNAGCVDSLMIRLPEADSLSVHIVQPCYFLNNTPFRPKIESTGKINSWKWSPFELFGSNMNSMDPLIYPNQNQWIYVNVMNNKGCISSDSAFLYRAPALKDAIPNAFTPNNDNINDVFGPHSLYQISKLKIVSRWGEIIYQGNLEGWNGFYQSALVGPGIYIYEIEANLQGSDKSQKATGTFLLLH